MIVDNSWKNDPMDNLTSSLISQLVGKALENTKAEDRLAFIEKLFGQLPPEGQQEFLLNLTRLSLSASASGTAAPGPGEGSQLQPRLIQLIPATSEDFAPGQICCQALTGLAKEDGMDEQEVVNVAQMFNGLADETRVKIVKLLGKGEFTVEELVEFLGVAQSTTSHHLKVLKDANLIKGEKRGRNTYYSLVDPEEAMVKAGSTPNGS
jgi:DNA-binding transcriptional ArsR family regulator